MLDRRMPVVSLEQNYHFNTLAFRSDAMVEPNQTPVASCRPLRRKSSFDEYQRRLVEKIKRHFERRRRQWEKNIENQAKSRRVEEEVEEEEEEETMVNESHDIIDLQKRPATKENDDEDGILKSTSCIKTTSTPASDVHPARHVPTGLTCNSGTENKQDVKSIQILSTERTDFPDEGKTKYTILVNIQSFLPFGSVTVRQEKDGLMLIGESDSQCNCRPRSRRASSRSYEKLVQLDGIVESDSMLVHTTRDGVMRIDVVMSQRES